MSQQQRLIFLVWAIAKEGCFSTPQTTVQSQIRETAFVVSVSETCPDGGGAGNGTGFVPFPQVLLPGPPFARIRHMSSGLGP